jgi:hypothetical protein
MKRFRGGGDGACAPEKGAAEYIVISDFQKEKSTFHRNYLLSPAVVDAFIRKKAHDRGIAASRAPGSQAARAPIGRWK